MATCDNKNLKVGISLAIVFLQCIFFAVTFIGWPSLVIIFQNENIFAICPAAETNATSGSAVGGTGQPELIRGNHCSEAENMFSLTFTIASVIFSLSSFPVGLLFDRYGIWITMVSGTVFYVAGMLFLAFTSSGAASYMVFPGLALLATGGMHIVVVAPHLSQQAGNKKTTVTTLNGGGMDSSVIMFLLVKLVYDYAGISYRWSLLFLTAMWVIALLNTFLLCPRYKVEIASSEPAAEMSDIKADGDGYVTSKKPVTFKDCLKSPLYQLMLLWFSLIHTRFYYTVGGLNTWLFVWAEGNQDTVSAYVNVFGYIAFGGMLVAPISGTLTDCAISHGVGTESNDPFLRKAKALTPSLWVGTFIAIFHSLVTIFPSPGTIYFSFVLLTIMRAFLYGNLFSYMALVFPMELFGKCFGFAFAFGGVIACLQYAFFIWAEKSGYQLVNILILIAMLFTVVLPIYIEVTYRREAKANKGRRINNRNDINEPLATKRYGHD